MLQALQLSCIRGERRLFADLSFELTPGSVLELVGANGSGKTSLLRVVCGLRAADAGEVRWNGESIAALGEDYLRELAFIGHANGIKEELTARENLHLAAAVRGYPVSAQSVDQALQRVGLTAQRDLTVRYLSQGQKRRVALAHLLLTQAALWLMDEPFTALDKQATLTIAAALSEHLQRGGMAILSTHQDVAIEAPQRQRLELHG